MDSDSQVSSQGIIGSRQGDELKAQAALDEYEKQGKSYSDVWRYNQKLLN